MAGRSRQRIEPSFSGSRRNDDDISFDAGERVAGGGRSGPSRNERPSFDDDDRRPKKPRRKNDRRYDERRPGIGLFGFIRRVVYWCIVLGIWAVIGIGGMVLYYGSRMPSASTWSIPERPPNVKIAAVDGTVVANRGTTGGEALALEDMSPYIPKAVIAIEDRRFYSHFGIDPLGLGRAIVTNVLHGRAVQGGSTLTQQLAKNLFLSPERTLERKVQEVLLSFWLEEKYSKDQILAMYLNRVFFGSNAYGVEAASRRYFSKSARDVTLNEAAILAGLLKAPTRLSPARDPEAAQARGNVVLQAMREEGFITDDQVKTAMSQAPTQAKSYWSGAEHYVADMVMDELPGLIGDVKEDIVVDTTIDLRLEKKAEQSLADVLDKDGVKLAASQAALVSIDGTGAIRALVGGRDYAESQFNRAVKAKRQPGSAFKPFVYAAALEQGLTPDTIRNDAPIRIGNWTPENYEKKYNGPVTLSTALAHSLNTVAAQLVMEVGPDRVIKLAHRLGIDSELQPNASIALGTSEVSLTELTSAYAAFMNGGYKATPHVIRRVTTADGKVLYENTYDEPPRVLSEQIVANMNAMMMGVINDGTGKAARIPGWQAAGKTGTTQNSRDALFVGFTSNLTTGVWFGNDDGKSMKKVTGGGLPAKAWQEFMVAAHKGLSPAPIFGNGQIIDNSAQIATSTTPPVEQPMPPPAPDVEQPTTIGTIISGVFGHTPAQPAPQPQVQSQPQYQQQQPAPALAPPSNDVLVQQAPRPQQPVYDNGGVVPPADVGGAPMVRQVPKRTTLLDFLIGQ